MKLSLKPFVEGTTIFILLWRLLLLLLLLLLLVYSWCCCWSELHCICCCFWLSVCKVPKLYNCTFVKPPLCGQIRTNPGSYLQKMRGCTGGTWQTRLHQQSTGPNRTKGCRQITSNRSYWLTKNKLINTLRTIKAQEGLEDSPYKRLYPTGGGTPNFLKGHPLRSIVLKQWCCYIPGGQGVG